MQISSGGIVYRIRNDGIFEIKLITTKSWKYSLPKGHVENNDSVEDTAIREVKEEAGIDASIVSYIGSAEWKLRSGDNKIVYIYLMKCILDGSPNDPDNEIIKSEWHSLHDAIRLVDFPPMRKLIIKAARLLSSETISLCVHCFNKTAIFIDWCEDCLIEAKNHLEKKHIKSALKNK